VCKQGRGGVTSRGREESAWLQQQRFVLWLALYHHPSSVSS
jgi:hypothetical protein